MKRVFFLSVGAVLFALIFVPLPGLHGSSIATAAYMTIENAGSALTQRSVLNFTGTGISCADNSGASPARTDCTVNSPGSGSFTLTNDTGTGTTNNKLAKINSSGNAVIATTSDTAIPVYVVTSGGGTSGSATLATSGLVTCTADASGVTVLHFVVASTSTNGDCKDAGATAPTSGWVLGIAQTAGAANATFTLALSEGYNAASGGGGGSFSAVPPYFSDGTHKFTSTGYQVTLPSSSPTWINSVTPTVVAASNGDVVASSTNTSNVYFATVTGATSNEAEFSCSGTSTNSTTSCAIWAYDSTNSHIWQFGINDAPNISTGGVTMVLNEWNYSGSGSPSFNTAVFAEETFAQSIYHLKIVKSGSSLVFSQSLNGGVTFVTVFTQTGIGTVSNLGYFLAAPGSGTNPLVIMDILSLLIS